MEQQSKAERSAPLPKLLFTIEEAAETLSLSRAYLYRLITGKRLRSIKIGGSRRIAFSELKAFVDELIEREA